MEYNFNKINKKIDKVINIAKKLKKESNDLSDIIEHIESKNVKYNEDEFITLANKAKELDNILKSIH